jgi:outer membrane biosynthesis protein TonB
MSRYKLIATVSAVGFYLFVLLLIAYYFGYHSPKRKPVNFTDKNGSAIKVTLASSAPSSARANLHHIPKKASNTKKTPIKSHHNTKKHLTKKHIKPKPKVKPHAKPKAKPKLKPKPISKPKPKPKNIPKPKVTPKKEVNAKNIKKSFQNLKLKKPETKKGKTKDKKNSTEKTDAKSSNHPKIDTKKLFSSIKKPTSSQKDNNGKDGGDSIKKSQKAKGINSKYLAKVQKALMNWPAQANFAGEEIDVILKIYPSGNFEYKVQKLSRNMDFNRELFTYLRQLKQIGFGPHEGNRPYEIEVKFIAHE